MLLFSSKTYGVEKDQIEFARNRKQAMNENNATGLPVASCKMPANANKIAETRIMEGNTGDL